MKSFYYKKPYADEQVRATISGYKTLMVLPVPEWQKPSLNKNFDGRFSDLKWISIAQKDARFGFAVFGENESSCMNNYNEGYSNLCPFFNVGERYWLKEAYGSKIRSIGGTPHESICYRSDNPKEVRCYDCNGMEYPIMWNPSFRMKKHESRCTIEVKRVYVKRLREINEEECKKFGARFTDFGMKCWHYGGVKSAEGCPYPKEAHQQKNGWHILDAPNSDHCLSSAKSSVGNWFEYKINSESWRRNDWCWFVEFEVVKLSANPC